MLLNKSYFVGERDIPNTVSLDVDSLLENLSNIHERDFLIKALGYGLFIPFIEDLKTGTPAQRTMDILFGQNYIALNGLPTRWDGLVAVTAEIKDDPLEMTIEGVDLSFDVSSATLLPELVSPLADYIYYRWLRQNSSLTTDLGQMKADSQNSTRVSPRYVQTQAWNSMVERTVKLKEFLYINLATYPEFSNYVGSRDLRLLLTKISPFF